MHGLQIAIWYTSGLWSLLSRSLIILTNEFLSHGWNLGIWIVKFSCKQSVKVCTLYRCFLLVLLPLFGR